LGNSEIEKSWIEASWIPKRDKKSLISCSDKLDNAIRRMRFNRKKLKNK
jgi:hypothetical protein